MKEENILGIGVQMDLMISTRNFFLRQQIVGNHSFEKSFSSFYFEIGAVLRRESEIMETCFQSFLKI